MTDLPYVLAAYGVVLATLGTYAFQLRGRLDRARRRRTLVDRRARVADDVRPDLPTPERL